MKTLIDSGTKIRGAYTITQNLPHGSNLTYETYDEGKFIKGMGYKYMPMDILRHTRGINEQITLGYKNMQMDTVNYTENPQIRLTDYNVSEDLPLYQYSSVKDAMLYDSVSLDQSFYHKLQKEFDTYKNPIQDQWALIGITIDDKGKRILNIASSINDVNFENYLYELLSKMNNWSIGTTKFYLRSPVHYKNATLYFAVLVDQNKIVIPEYYNYQMNMTELLGRDPENK